MDNKKLKIRVAKLEFDQDIIKEDMQNLSKMLGKSIKLGQELANTIQGILKLIEKDKL